MSATTEQLARRASYTVRDAYIAAVATRPHRDGPDSHELGLWHRIADPEAPHALRATRCGLTIGGLVIVTPWLPPAGEAVCTSCSAATLTQLDVDQLQQDGAQ